MNSHALHRIASAAAALAALLAAPAAPAQDVETLIDRAMTGAHRSDKNKARDKYRHPKETLVFFGLRPDMSVVEITPGAGWYTEILGPVLREHGRLQAALFALTPQSSEGQRNNDRNYRSLLEEHRSVLGDVRLAVLSPESMQVAPPGSTDLVLTFRNVHNWAKAGTVEVMFKAFYDALKPGGVLGVVEHRAAPGTPFPRQVDSGYMTEQYVIEAAQRAGFKLANKSEINANPRDTKDYPGGVWTLPPTLRNVTDAEKPKYQAIGESDRMTLKFDRP
jgi:predicted methyltransferase